MLIISYNKNYVLSSLRNITIYYTRNASLCFIQCLNSKRPNHSPKRVKLIIQNTDYPLFICHRSFPFSPFLFFFFFSSSISNDRARTSFLKMLLVSDKNRRSTLIIYATLNVFLTEAAVNQREKSIRGTRYEKRVVVYESLMTERWEVCGKCWNFSFGTYRWSFGRF